MPILHIEMSQMSWLDHLFGMPLRCFPGEVFWRCPTGKRLGGRPRTRWRNNVSPLDWEKLGSSWMSWMEEVTMAKEVLGLLRQRPSPG